MITQKNEGSFSQSFCLPFLVKRNFFIEKVEHSNKSETYFVKFYLFFVEGILPFFIKNKLTFERE